MFIINENIPVRSWRASQIIAEITMACTAGVDLGQTGIDVGVSAKS